MSRPRVIKLEDGEISFQGFSTERANELVKLLTEKPEVKQVQAKTADLPDTGVGLFFNPTTKNYGIATLRFDAVSKQAVVDSIEESGQYKAVAQREFMVTTVKLGLT